MCLLDEVIDWDAQHIRCRTATHRAPDNPLRSHDRLGIACGIEYVAQAMALHGALTNGAAGGANAVDAIAGRSSQHLICEVTHLAGDGMTALYEFALRDRDRSLLSGRASVILDAAGRIRP